MAKVFQVNTASGGTLTTSLVSYYKLEDATDFFGSNNLTNNGSTTFTSGKVSNAATFNGTSQYLSLGSPLSATTGDQSVAFWIKVSSTSAASGWFHNGNTLTNPNSNGFGVGQGNGTYDGAGNHINVVCSQVNWFNSTSTLTTGWHFVAVTYTSSTNVWRIYLDGTTADATTMTATIVAADTKMQIGMAQENGGPLDYTNGQIDELGYWTKVLSTNELTDLYNGGSGQTMINSVANTGNMLQFF